MALVDYRVEYGATWATCTNVATDVQSFNCTVGRKKQLDQYSANTGSVTLRYPTGYASPNAFWVSGTVIKVLVRWNGSAGAYRQIFTGQINDVSVKYGIPYAGGVGNADFVTLTLESHFAQWGRVQGNNYAMPAGILNNQTDEANLVTGLNAGVLSGYGSSTLFPATTVSGSWGDWVNRVLLTMNGRMIDNAGQIVLSNQYWKYAPVYGNFSDTTNDADNHIYENIDYSSYADNYYTQVIVTPESYSTQKVQIGAIPYRTYQVNTLNSSTSQALDYANYLLSTYKSPVLGIQSVSCNLNAQSGDIPGYGSGSEGTAVTVAFRGTTYRCVIEGSTWSGTPDSCRATFHFSSADLNNYLILNNTAGYGRLDFNKLGY
jgi:hypothetical protein